MGHPLTRCHYLVFDPENHPANTVRWYSAALAGCPDAHGEMDGCLTVADPATFPAFLTMDAIGSAIRQTQENALTKRSS